MRFDEQDPYIGLATLHWAAISDTDPRWDQAFYKRIIQQNSGRALELGCGAGRLLLAYLADGFEVHGVDRSGAMLAVCRDQAAAAGLAPVLYEQPMQCLRLPYAYKTIYIPCGSFVCVMGRVAALETLRRCYAHLEQGGVLAFNVYLPDYDYAHPADRSTFPGPWQLKAEKQLQDGRRLRVFHRPTGLDQVEQIWMEERRYELYNGDALVQEEVHRGQGHWYFRNELLWMLQLAGFSDVIVKGDFTDEDFNTTHTRTMVFLASKRDGGV
ncbi:MAG: class I SAM-dependent methyltransferase [Chloroflexota bacterium]|nr:class I SAM-dependent methyltransferase [Chloroflexota bacterium]